MPDSVDAAIVRRWCVTGLGALRRHQAEIDALNVYPVPDGDTGTNLVLTMAAAVQSLGDRSGAPADGADAVVVSGAGAVASGADAVVVSGAGAVASGADAVVVSGADAVASGADAVVVSGAGAVASGAGAVVGGPDASVGGPDGSVGGAAAVVGGRGALAEGPDAVVGGAGAAADGAAAGDGAGVAGGGAAAGGASSGADDLGGVLRDVAQGALLGARGNSGIILAQLFKGLAGALGGVVAADGQDLARALDEAAKAAYRAVAAPVEGTVLSVGAAAARAALAAASAPDDGAGDASGRDRGASDGTAGRDVVAVARAAAEAARVALARTPEQLPALARAGVVDAGGRGLVVLLDALVETLTGEAPPDMTTGAARPAPGLPGGSMEREAGSDAYGYEVQYLLRAAAGAVDELRRVLAGLGDSLVVVGEEPVWHVHVHVNDVGAAIEAGVEAGRPSRITVTRFADQVAALASADVAAVGAADADAGVARAGAAGAGAAGVRLAAAADGARDSFDEVRVGGARGDEARHGDEAWTDAPRDGEAWDRNVVRIEQSAAGASRNAADGSDDATERAVVVVCSGPGLAELLAAEGATVLTGSPSTGEILAAIRRTGAGRVVVLPNDSNVLAVASAAAAEARAEGIRAGVVPTRSPVQALAAMAVRDAARRFEDDVIAMAEAAARCRSAEVTIAGREALTVAGRCQPGDVLAIVDGEVNLIGQDLSRTAVGLLDRMLGGGGELVTLIVGRGAPAGLSDTLREHVEGAWPFVEVQCYEGGQPHYPLLVGVE
ncbi:DAK2 domain-containing protein [Dactylosporangium sp. CA-139066]|uniref:DAK2 domain-containing protein n=1 Tax=Dactylosporangium sp. CA-139066 TaxID=3239930 RepID=UPI003D8F5BD7